MHGKPFFFLFLVGGGTSVLFIINYSIIDNIEIGGAKKRSFSSKKFLKSQIAPINYHIF